MKIKGIGTDICAVKRIAELLKDQGERFVERVLTESEIEAKGGKESLIEDAAFMARRFAAKEAIAKALGTGIGKQLAFHDMIIDRQGNRRPTVTFANGKMEGITVHLSVSDENDFALAFAVAMIDGETTTASNPDAEQAETKPKRTRKPFGRRNAKKDAKPENSDNETATADLFGTDTSKTEAPVAAAVEKTVPVEVVKTPEAPKVVETPKVIKKGIQVTVITANDNK
jgi:holo-[acyl-carrier protein] synthase